MTNPEIPPKSVKVLFVLYELGGKAGHNKLVIHFKKIFPDVYMNPKLLTAHLHYLYEKQKIKKAIKYSRGIWKPDYPQTYEITNDKGIYSLKKWGMI